jgi:WD40 repeat protein
LQILHTIDGHNGAIYDVIYCDGFLFTTSADKFVVQWNVKSGEQTKFAVKLDYSSYNIAFSPVSNLLAVGTNKGGIHVIDTEKREEIRLLTQHKTAIFALTYCPKKHVFYSGDLEGIVCVWDAKTFDLLITLPYNCGKIREISTNEAGEFLAICGQDGYIRILESAFFNLVQEFKAHKDGVNCALFDGDQLYTGGKDAHIRKWNWRDKKEVLSIPAHNYAVYDLAFIDNKQKIISVSFDKSIKVWKTQDLSIIERIEFKNKGHRHTVNRIAKISEQSFATVGDDRKIKIWGRESKI